MKEICVLWYLRNSHLHYNAVGICYIFSDNDYNYNVNIQCADFIKFHLVFVVLIYLYLNPIEHAVLENILQCEKYLASKFIDLS